MSAAKTLLRPIVAATLLAGLVLPAQAETSHGAPAAHEPPPEPAKAPIQAPLFTVNTHVNTHANTHAEPIVKKVVLQRHAPSKRYRVKRGDCLWTISRAYLGHGRKWRAIYQANLSKIRNPDLIYPGQLLQIPRRPYLVQSKRERHVQSRQKTRIAHRMPHTIRVSELSPQANPHAAPLQDAFRPSHVAAHPATAPKKDLPPVARAESPAPESEHDRHQAATASPPKIAGMAVQAPNTHHGHRRIKGSFYTHKNDQLVWADDGTPVQGKQVQRVTAEHQPLRPKPVLVDQVAETQPARPKPVLIDQVALTHPVERGPIAVKEPSIQGHRRINGSFFVRSGALLLWADTLEPVRNQDPQEIMVAP